MSKVLTVLIPVQMKGIKVLSKHMPDMFEKILGYDEYLPKIEAANGNTEKLREIFWNDLADDYRWEFINGEIILRSGFNMRNAIFSQNLSMALFTYVREKDLGLVLTGRCVCSFAENDYSPTAFYYRKEIADGFKADTNRFPVPAMILELNDENTEENNRSVKFNDYEKNGVEEYWMLNCSDQSIEQYINRKGVYDFEQKLFYGDVLTSKVIEGFTMRVSEIFEV